MARFPSIWAENPARIQITSDTAVALWDGSTPNYAWCVEALLAG